MDKSRGEAIILHRRVVVDSYSIRASVGASADE